jgi:iron complex outermembrane receptor protein
MTTIINRHFIKYFLCCLNLFFSYSLYAQDQPKEAEEKDIYSLSIEELMDVTISSASKKEETLFDAPLSSHTITKADIDRSGVATVMEALRLAPGVIVREITNGIYDIHIRGFDNITRDQHSYQKTNFATLIMIDSRPVYNPVQGATYWETIPIDLNNIERIEIIRGPSAALFGPNAVSGVVNIITRRATGDAVNVVANAQVGTSHTQILNASVGKKMGNWNVTATANYQNRGKYDDQYFSIAQQKFVNPANLVLFTDPQSGQAYYMGDSYKQNLAFAGTSLSHAAANAFIGYQFKDDIKLDLTIGTMKSETQKIFSGGIPDTYFSSGRTSATHANLAFTAKNFRMRSSMNSNTEDSNPGNQNLGIVTLVQKYDYTLTDAVTEYDFKTSDDRYKVTPGISYQGINFDDTKYHDNVNTIGLLNGNPTMTNFSGYLRSDLNFTNKLRVMAALSADKFSAPDKAYINYELATTYKVSATNLIHFAITRANSGSYIGNNYNNLVLGGFQIFTGNTNLKLFTIDMQEIGFRSKFSRDSQLDVDVFRQKGDNFTVISGNTYANSQMQATQYGATISLNYAASEKFQLKPFITVQSTATDNRPVGWTKEHTHTPRFYGGYYLNLRPIAKMNINLNGYYFAAHTQYDSHDFESGTTNEQAKIKGKFLVNFKASYTILKGLNLFVNARNALNARSREFYAADQTRAVYLIGMSFNMN